MVAEGEEAEGARVPMDPCAVDPEAAAREEADRYGLPFEVALENVRVSMAKRAAALARIRTIREKGEARIAARQTMVEAGRNGSGAEPDAEEGDAMVTPDGPS